MRSLGNSWRRSKRHRKTVVGGMVVGISENEETSCKNRLCLCVCVLLRSIQWRLVCGCDLRSSMWPATNHDSLFGCPSFLFLMVMLVAANFGLQDPWRPTKQLVRGCHFDGCRGFSAIDGSSATLPIGCFLQAMGVRHIHIGGLVRKFIHKCKKEREQQRCQLHFLSPPISSFSCSS